MNSTVEIKKNFSLKGINTFGIDAIAESYCEFENIEELRSILSNTELSSMKKLPLGGGSNILFTSNFEGLVLHNKIKGIEVVREDNEHAWVKAGAGEVWHELVLFCIEKNLGGIENLSLIPGTVGAAPIQNIGAYGVELKDVFDCLEAVDINNGSINTFCKGDCCFGYRESIFKTSSKGKYIITSVTLKLNKKSTFNTSYGAIADTIKEMGIQELSLRSISDAVIKIRSSKLPNPAEIGNAGSFFKNPEISVEHFEKLKTLYPGIPSYLASEGKVKVPAGWLNEQCGWKGKVIGNTGVHKLQALVLVNYGGAKGEEVKNLSEAIKASVLEKFGIQLETEVNII